MINYRKILEMHQEEISQCTISSSTGHLRDKIREVVNQAKAKGLVDLTDEMTNLWLENYLFPERSANHRGYYHPDWDYVHKELLKKNVILKLLHKDTSRRQRSSIKFLMRIEIFVRNIGIMLRNIN